MEAQDLNKLFFFNGQMFSLRRGITHFENQNHFSSRRGIQGLKDKKYLRRGIPCLKEIDFHSEQMFFKSWDSI